MERSPRIEGDGYTVIGDRDKGIYPVQNDLLEISRGFGIRLESTAVSDDVIVNELETDFDLTRDYPLTLQVTSRFHIGAEDEDDLRYSGGSIPHFMFRAERDRKYRDKAPRFGMRSKWQVLCYNEGFKNSDEAVTVDGTFLPFVGDSMRKSRVIKFVEGLVEEASDRYLDKMSFMRDPLGYLKGESGGSVSPERAEEVGEAVADALVRCDDRPQGSGETMSVSEVERVAAATRAMLQTGTFDPDYLLARTHEITDGRHGRALPNKPSESEGLLASIYRRLKK
jgi:hypothetical protein